tara:strand:- start:48 stop:389 length:342 start_codon:yes stop_codon:yes gene_type:complete
MNWIEVMGWVGNVLVITQFLQKDMLKLRVLGVLGGSVWLVVAIMMNSVSLAVLNFVIIGIQLYHIRKLRMVKNKTPLDFPIVYQELDNETDLLDTQDRMVTSSDVNAPIKYRL